MAVYSVGVLALYFGFGISQTTGLLGTFLGAAVVLLISSHGKRWKSLAVLAVVLFIGGLTSYWFFDFSSDGVGYHKQAIIQFLSGWNPYLDGSSMEGVSFWTAIYPKASWILGAQIVAVTGLIETGKLINLLGILMAFLAAYRFLYPRLPKSPTVALLTAVLIGFNPVSTYQSLTFYLDGLLASVITVLLFSLAELLQEHLQKMTTWEVAFAAILLANLKFTGLVYTCVILFCFILILTLEKKIKPALVAGIFATVILFLAAFVYGKTPYLDNLNAGRNIFYPVMGGSTELFSLKGFRPKNLNDQNRLQRWLISNISHSQSVYPPNEAVIRLPLDFSRIGRHWVDTNVGGFGPLFAEAILTLGCVLFFGWWLLPKLGWPSTFLIVSILFSSFSHKDAWWARYAPQMFLLPVLGACFLVRAEKKWVKQAGIVIVGLLIVNLAVVGALSTATKAWGNHLWRIGIKELKKESTVKPIRIDFKEYTSIKRTLKEMGVNYYECKSSNCTTWSEFPVIKKLFWRKAPLSE